MDAEDDTLPATPDSAPPPPSSAQPPDLPPTIGRFEVQSKLGEGGMGTVLLASDPLLNRRVAIKILRTGASTDMAKRRLLREAQGTAQLSHENVIVVHDVGTHEDRVYLAMEYVPGETLRRRQANRTWREILALYLRAGRGLQAAHDAGLVHRDFKPDNVLVGSDGRLRVTDFGLVAESDAPPDSFERPPNAGDNDLALPLTQTGAIMGTPRYMAPEQHRGGRIDARADQFAFCVSLYEALYHRTPFAGATYAEIAENVEAGRFTPPPADSEVPSAVRDAIVRGLSRDREARFPSMHELLATLASVASPRSRTWIAALAIIVSVAAIASAILYVGRGRNDPPTPPAPPPVHDVTIPRPTPPPPVVEGSTSKLDVSQLDAALGAYNYGAMAFANGDYDEAAAQFEAGYAALKVPQWIYNRAASFFMKAKRTRDPAVYRRASELYAQYLESDPLAPGVSEAIAAIGAEAARLEQKSRTPSAIEKLGEPAIRGFVLFTSEPAGATVYIDDVAKGPVGTTPWAGTLSGQHTIIFAKPGFLQLAHAGELEAHRLSVQSVVLAPAP